MGSFLDDDNDRPAVQEDKYLKFADPEQGKAVEVKIRILDQKPAKVFRHWIGSDPKAQRPYNCPSRQQGCLACQERQVLRDRGEDARDVHRMDKRYLVNALVLSGEKKVQLFSFGQKLGEKLDFLHDRYGDLRDLDLTIIKRRTGPLKMNVEYDAIYEDKRALTDEEKSLAEQRFDLDAEVKPSSLEDISNAVRGLSTKTSVPENASAEQITAIVNLAKKKGFTLEDLGVYNKDKLTYERAEKLIKELQ